MARWFGIIAGIFLITVFAFAITGVKTFPDYNFEKGVGVVKIDSKDIFHTSERPSVFFPHDLHTGIYSEDVDSCRECHQTKENILSTQFLGIEKNNQKEMMDSYHEGCIGCHNKYIASGENSGPVICSGCHIDKKQVFSLVEDAGFDKSLHYRHVESLGEKCELCHHQYDQEKKKLFYKKGNESSCIYCHPAETDGESLNLQKASHESCVICHKSMQDEKKKTGPIKCANCHDSEKRKTIKTLDRVPALKMNQPEAVVLKSHLDTDMEMSSYRMDFVPFNHKTHEEKNESCRICHHKELSSCLKCHTVKEIDDEKNISLEKVMHKVDSERSCVGCHEKQKKQPECSGCHFFDVQSRKEEKAGCVRCHMVSEVVGNESDFAFQLIESRMNRSNPVNMKQIPETIIINKLEKEYKPVTFPHRKIIDALSINVENNRMARFFHSEKETICMGCHHNSPATEKPSACSSCHPIHYKENELYKPRLKGAYHIQCMECHYQMNIKQTDSCIGCHEEKKSH